MATLPPAYTKEIQALERRVIQDRPSDILQFCSDFFAQRLARERAAYFSCSSRPSVRGPPEKKPKIMSTPGFTSPFGANANPFGGSGISRSISPGAMQRVIEEDESDATAAPRDAQFLQVGYSPGNNSGFDGAGGSANQENAPSSGRYPSPSPDAYPAQYNFGRRTSVSAESLKPESSDNWLPPFHPKTPEQLERLRTAIQGNFLFSHLDDEQSAQVLGALVEKPIPAKDIKVSAIKLLGNGCTRKID